MSFFDEPPEALAQCILGLKDAGCDHLVALDGRYALFDAPQALSPEDQHAVILKACRSLGMGVTLHLPPHEWLDGEREKRTHLFAVALAEAEPGDWFVVMDADQVVVEAPPDLKAQLEMAEQDTAVVGFHDLNVAMLPDGEREAFVERFAVRVMFRAQPIVCSVNHYTYVNPLDGRMLWSAAGEEREPEPALDLRQLVTVEHRKREKERVERKMDYYGARDESQVERGRCRWVPKKRGKIIGPRCEAKASRRVPANVRNMAEPGAPVMPICDMQEMCEPHARQCEETAAARLRHWKMLCSCGVSVQIRQPDGMCGVCHKPLSMGRRFRWVDRHDPVA